MSRRNRESAAPSVRKASGEVEPFRRRKLYESLRACGADKALATRITDTVEAEYRPGLTTQELTRLTSRVLTRESRQLAARYLLKKSLLDLGPSGYPFERLIAELFAAQGHRTTVGVTLEGKCVSHEIDVVARRNDATELVECKFRSGPGMRCDVKIALYVHARALDLRAHPDGVRFDRFHLVTNTKFTGDAVRYGECVGLELLGWDHPGERPLPRLLEDYRLHPLTCLTSLSRAHKRDLISEGFVLCRDLLSDPRALDGLELGERRRRRLIAEVEALLDSP